MKKFRKSAEKTVLFLLKYGVEITMGIFVIASLIIIEYFQQNPVIPLF